MRVGWNFGVLLCIKIQLNDWIKTYELYFIK